MRERNIFMNLLAPIEFPFRSKQTIRILECTISSEFLLSMLFMNGIEGENVEQYLLKLRRNGRFIVGIISKFEACFVFLIAIRFNRRTRLTWSQADNLQL